MTTIIRPARAADLAGMVAIHQAAFANHFMTRLGPRFLHAYYRCLLQHPGQVVLVAEAEAGQVFAFVAGFANAPLFYQRLRQRRLRLALTVAPELLRRPGLALRLLHRAGTVDQRAAGVGAAPIGGLELASLACLPEYRGRGAGRALTQAMLDATEAAGLPLCFLTTDRDDNVAVRSLYESMGFVEDGVEFVQQGRPVCRYIRSFNSAEAA